MSQGPSLPWKGLGSWTFSTFPDEEITLSVNIKHLGASWGQVAKLMHISFHVLYF